MYIPRDPTRPRTRREYFRSRVRDAGLHLTGTPLLPGRFGAAVADLLLLPEADITAGRWTYFNSVPRVARYAGAPDERIEVGAFCSISDDITFVLSGNHDMRRVTTSPVRELFGIEGYASSREVSGRGTIRIGNDVWIGRGAWILSGAEIGDGAVVGARSVVSGKVEPYSVVVGSPAREVRRRFDAETVARLRASAWWDLPDDVLKGAVDLLSGHDIGAFLDHVEALHIAR